MALDHSAFLTMPMPPPVSGTSRNNLPENSTERGWTRRKQRKISLGCLRPPALRTLKGAVVDAVLETILVVDDDPAVLGTVVAILRRAGFDVLMAGSRPAAVVLTQKRAGKIDLLLSDVEMPEMSGPALGEVLKTFWPDIHVMLMSGGKGEGNLLVLNYGWAFIEKPFLITKLVQMVSDVLHTPNRSQPGGREFDSRKDHKDAPKTS